MSVPPQQPGPFGQQPGPQGPQPGGPGQRPGQFGPPQGFGAQPGGYPPPPPGFPQGGQPQPPYGPPGGFPPPGHPGAPGFGQPPYGPPGQFGQPGYGQPGGFGDPYGAPRRKSPLPWVLGGAGVVVIGVIAVLLLTLTGGNSAKDTAEQYVALLNKKTSASQPEMRKLLCAGDARKVEEIDRRPDKPTDEADSKLQRIEGRYTLGDVKENGSTAEATVNATFSNVPEDLKDFIKDGPKPLKLVKEDDEWKVCGLFDL